MTRVSEFVSLGVSVFRQSIGQNKLQASVHLVYGSAVDAAKDGRVA